MFRIIARFVLSCIYKLLYRHTVEWSCDLSGLSGPAIIAPNHVSYLDPQLVFVSWPGRLHFFARADLFRRRLSALILRGLCAHPVVRGKGLATLRQALDLLGDGEKIVLFPEGTRSLDGAVGPLRDGVAFLSRHVGCPIIPCSIQGSHEIWPKGRRFPKIFGTRTVCRFGRPIWPRDEQGDLLSNEQINRALREQLVELGLTRHDMAS